MKSSLKSIYYTQEAVRDSLRWGFQKDSEVLELFNYHLQKIQESGVYRRLEQKMYYDLNEDDTEKEDYILEDAAEFEDYVLSYKNVAIPFSVLQIGLLVSLLQLGLEAMKKKCKIGTKRPSRGAPRTRRVGRQGDRGVTKTISA